MSDARNPECQDCDLHWNSVAYASANYQRERSFLATMVADAVDHGLTFADLRAASGLDPVVIVELLGETSL